VVLALCHGGAQTLPSHPEQRLGAAGQRLTAPISHRRGPCRRRRPRPRLRSRTRQARASTRPPHPPREPACHNTPEMQGRALKYGLSDRRVGPNPCRAAARATPPRTPRAAGTPVEAATLRAGNCRESARNPLGVTKWGPKLPPTGRASGSFPRGPTRDAERRGFGPRSGDRASRVRPASCDGCRPESPAPRFVRAGAAGRPPR
jgi:hypothetical protein